MKKRYSLHNEPACFDYQGSVTITQHSSNASDSKVAVLVASNGRKGDRFGFASDISEDGAVVVVSSHIDNQGQVYVFERNEGSGSYNQSTLLKYASGDVNSYGINVSVSRNGKYIAIAGIFKESEAQIGYLYVNILERKEDDFKPFADMRAEILTNGKPLTKFQVSDDGNSIEFGGNDNGSFVAGHIYQMSHSVDSQWYMAQAPKKVMAFDRREKNDVPNCIPL